MSPDCCPSRRDGGGRPRSSRRPSQSSSLSLPDLGHKLHIDWPKKQEKIRISVKVV